MGVPVKITPSKGKTGPKTLPPGPGKRFEKGNRLGRGRPKGSANKLPLEAKEAIIEALTKFGDGGDLIEAADGVYEREGGGRDGLVGFVTLVAKRELKSAAMLFAKVIPMQMNASVLHKSDEPYRSVEEIEADMRSRGIPLEHIRVLQYHHDIPEHANVLDLDAAK
jgi:hypothetical protein